MEEKEYEVTLTISMIVEGTSVKDAQSWFENFYSGVRLGEMNYDIKTKVRK